MTSIKHASGTTGARVRLLRASRRSWRVWDNHNHMQHFNASYFFVFASVRIQGPVENGDERRYFEPQFVRPSIEHDVREINCRHRHTYWNMTHIHICMYTHIYTHTYRISTRAPCSKTCTRSFSSPTLSVGPGGWLVKPLFPASALVKAPGSFHSSYEGVSEQQFHGSTRVEIMLCGKILTST